VSEGEVSDEHSVRPGIQPGVAWGIPCPGEADRVVAGGDADLAGAFAARPNALFGLAPDGSSDLAATLGLRRGSDPVGLELRIDVLWVSLDGHDERAVCATATFGCRPQALGWSNRRRPGEITVDGRVRAIRAAGVVVANTQHLDRLRIVPRGHPGDGRAEAQWFAVAPAERAKFRARLVTGDHVDHPAVGRASFRTLALRWDRPVAVWLDSRPVGPAKLVRLRVDPGALRLRV
jgi:YegS C-terminal NAD kinase beta sandwich-like domain